MRQHDKNNRKGKISLKTYAILCLIMLLLVNACSGDSGESIFFDATNVSIAVNEEFVLKVNSSNNSNSTIVFESSNSLVATVQSDGTVTGKSTGRAVIKAKAGKSEASVEVFVLEDKLPVLGYKKIWTDEFDGVELDRTKWNYQTGIRDYYGTSTGPTYWGNNEQQYYTEDAVTVDGGSLVILAKKEQRGDRDYTSARIVTRDLKSFTYGYVEARIKLPIVDGMWPAFWMLPQPISKQSGQNTYGGWAASGEIDIMEAKGRFPYEASQALHYGGGYPNNTYSSHTTRLSMSIAQWHTYAIEWTSESISWYLDGVKEFELNKEEWWSSNSDKESAPFDVPFFILLNLAVGGNFDGGIVPPKDFESAEMLVDYVRIYQKS